MICRHTSFLATPMECEEYVHIKMKHISLNVQVQYNLSTKVTPDDYIYIQIKRSVYGLNQEAVLAYENLKTCLDPYGYLTVIGTVGW